MVTSLDIKQVQNFSVQFEGTLVKKLKQAQELAYSGNNKKYEKKLDEIIDFCLDYVAEFDDLVSEISREENSMDVYDFLSGQKYIILPDFIFFNRIKLLKKVLMEYVYGIYQWDTILAAAFADRIIALIENTGGWRRA